MGSCESPTRAIFAGGNEGYNYPTTAVAQNTIDYVTIQLLVMHLILVIFLMVEMVLLVVHQQPEEFLVEVDTGTTLSPLITTNVIQYITIASLGNATDFGDLTQDRERFTGTSNAIRGIFGGGQITQQQMLTQLIMSLLHQQEMQQILVI